MLIVLSFVFLITSCGQKRKNTKVRSIGNTSEILVVLDSEQQWDNIVGKTIRSYFGQEQYGLPQPEPVFKLAHLTKRSFSELFKKHRNILIIQIDPKKYAIPKVETFEDLWASPQRVIHVQAPDNQSFVKLLNSRAEAIAEKYNQAERQRILSVYRPSSRNKVTDKLVKTFGLKMTIPSGFFTAKTEPGFMWVRKEANDYSQGIMVISETYKDTAQFSTASIVARTNRFLMQYVPGEADSSFMQIDQEFVVPRTKAVTGFVSDYTIEMRGLWKVEGDFMGGPFLSYTFLDPRTNHIVTLYGYVYRPSKKKCNLLRQVEAILYSTRFVD